MSKSEIEGVAAPRGNQVPIHAVGPGRLHRLGEVLVGEGILTQEQLNELLRRQTDEDQVAAASVLDKYRRDHYPKSADEADWVISFEHVTKHFGAHTAVHDVNFKIFDLPGKGEFICVLGPSGCGKSTILSMIAGFYPPTAGRVMMKGNPIRGPGPERGMVFQIYSSFRNLTVWENVAFGLHLKELNRSKNPLQWLVERFLGVRGARRRRMREEAMHWIKLVGLDGSERKYPHELSGGMRQRVAIARTLAVKPKVLLMDEPFGALDRVTRWEMQDLLVRIWQEVQATVFLVTHDLAEAVYLGDRVFILSESPGRLLEEVSVPPPDRPAAEMQRMPEFNAIVNEISAKVERGYFERRMNAH
jgi:ABC-type nitrate/sulfonate/bicarbonate transport system ATPase subunit